MSDLPGIFETHIFPTPSYTDVSFGSDPISFDVSSISRMSRCLVEIWALQMPICCCELINWASIS